MFSVEASTSRRKCQARSVLITEICRHALPNDVRRLPRILGLLTTTECFSPHYLALSAEAPASQLYATSEYIAIRMAVLTQKVTVRDAQKSEDVNTTIGIKKAPIRYPFWFGGSASCFATIFTHPLDLGKLCGLN